jgi:glycerophosphoryl diester phosphodiesterase
VEIVSPPSSLVAREEVLAAQRAGIQIVPWTAGDPALWRKLADAQVDGIISDDPVALIFWLRSAGLR